MRILFVHQSFPGQYRHIVRSLASSGSHQIVALGINNLAEPIPKSITYIQYKISRGNTVGLHDWLLDVDSKLIRGEACATQATQLKNDGFTPDIICAHPGWGEALFLKDIWPNVPLLCYQEFYYNSYGFDFDFDPEFSSQMAWTDRARIRFKNINPMSMLEASNWNVTPTHFQRSTFPQASRQRISVIHDGIDTTYATPISTPQPLPLPDGTVVKANELNVTFVNRSIEPYRGCHTFIRSIPYILDKCPEAHIFIVGSPDTVSYGMASPNLSWRDTFLAEISGNYDPTRIHFTGALPYSNFIHLLQLSKCHVYLSYPFVLSWSMLEAMSIACPIVGSRTAPVQEFIQSGHNGLLVDFFSPKELSEAIKTILTDVKLSKNLGEQARNLIESRYSLKKCVPLQLALIELVQSGALD